MWPKPEIPRWAIEAGCPQPHSQETFYDYVERLGLNFDEMVADIDSRIPDTANRRLARALEKGAPECFDRYRNQL